MATLYKSQILSHSNVVVSYQTNDALNEINFDLLSQRFFMTTLYKF